MALSTKMIVMLGLAACTACSSSEAPRPDGNGSGGGGGDTSAPPAPAGDDGPTLKSDVTPVTRADQAKPYTFIPPYVDCRAPKQGETGASNGKVCTPVALSGCTEEGKYYPDYASCDVIRTQRPYWPADAKGSTKPDDPRLQDSAFMSELAWVTAQARATACTCCHEAAQAPDHAPSQWSIDAKGIWTDTASDAAIALFAGYADSSIFGAYDPHANNGFERSETGLPSTDGDRMRAFFTKELARRGITPEQAAKFPPFGGPLYDNQHRAPTPCTDGQGVDASGAVRWDASTKARYVYVLDAGAANPGVPPNLDLPAGTIWRLDVLASADPLASGVRYGTTPAGSFQAFPETGRAPALTSGKTYHLFVLRDVAVVATNCLFTAP